MKVEKVDKVVDAMRGVVVDSVMFCAVEKVLRDVLSTIDKSGPREKPVVDAAPLVAAPEAENV